MGGGRDKRKKHDKKLGKVSSTKLSGQAKTERKTEQNAKKKKGRTKDDDAENDIERILKELEIKDAERTEIVIEANCGRPIPGRASCTFTATTSSGAGGCGLPVRG